MSDVDDIIAAARAGDAQRVSELLDEDPSLANVTGAQGESPLIVALYSRADDVVRLLLDRGAAANIFESAAIGDTATVKAMLTANPTLLTAYSYDGWTALHLAAHFGQTAAVIALLDAGADVNARSRNSLDNMPLHAAVAAHENEALARLLLERGAQVNAIQHGGFTPLHETAQNGYIALSRLLVEFGANPAALTDDGKTARQLAEEQGHTELAKLL